MQASNVNYIADDISGNQDDQDLKKPQKRQGRVWPPLKDCVGEQTLRQLGLCALWCDVALRMRKEKRTREQGSSTLPAGLLGNILNSSMWHTDALFTEGSEKTSFEGSKW